MPDEGRLIALQFRDMQRIYGEIELLLATAGVRFAEFGWTPFFRNGDTGAFPGRSMIDPTTWLPSRIFRVMTHKEHAATLSFVSVRIELPAESAESDEGNAKTTLSAGLIAFHEPGGWNAPKPPTEAEWSALCLWHLHRKDRRDDGSLTPHLPIEWRPGWFPQNLTKMLPRTAGASTLGLPIDAIADGDALGMRVVSPVVHLADAT